MKAWTLMIQRNSMIPRYSMIQRKFQLEVWNLIIQKSTVIPPSSLVLFSFTIDPPNNKCHTIVVCLMAMFVIPLLFHCYAESLTSTQRHRIICISIQSSLLANTFKSLTTHNIYYWGVDFFLVMRWEPPVKTHFKSHKIHQKYMNIEQPCKKYLHLRRWNSKLLNPNI